MVHTPHGYRIENGKAVIDETSAEQVRTLFASYLSGDSLDTASKKSGILSVHGSIGRILQNTRYLGDEYYPALIESDTFVAVQGERLRRSKMLGRVYEFSRSAQKSSRKYALISEQPFLQPEQVTFEQ